MELILWRHADAEDGRYGIRDHERELTAKGKKQAQKIAAWLAPQLPKDINGTRIIVSPATRTIQTAEALGRQFEISDLLSTRGSLADHLAAARWPDEDVVLLVGHQPTLGQVAALLMSGYSHHWDVKKGAVWWLRSSPHSEEGTAKLKAMMTPAMLE